MDELFLSLHTPGDVRKGIGELVKAMRQSRKITQDQLAKSLGLTRLTIQKVESGKNSNIDTLLLIFQYFEILEPFSSFIIEQRNKFADFGSFY